jgi:uncharacterized membrane protein
LPRSRSYRTVRIAGLLLGLGMGGFVDGILPHQILQWPDMLSARIPPTNMEAMHVDMRADGLFHAAVWLVVLAGIVLLYRAAREPGPLPPLRWLAGLMLAGWGAFHLVEGTINHIVLELHHVRDLPVHVPLYDHLFLGIGGVGFLLLAWLIARSAPAARDA